MLKIATILGGMSTEHDISVKSGLSIINNLDKNIYDIHIIYISKKGKWYTCKTIDSNIDHESFSNNLKPIHNIVKYLEKMDCIFPILHGKYGEDGTIQGMMEILKIPYVGCGVLSSSISMDKIYTKIILEKANIKQSKYICVKKEKDKYIYLSDNLDEHEINIEDLIDKIVEKINLPVFVKPSKSGSSIGVNKASNKCKLKENIIEAFKYDNKILVEEEIKGKEVECAVLEDKEIIASPLGEIIADEEFYTFDSKYNNKKTITKMPASIDESMEKSIKEMAIKAFKAVDGSGLARVDFFISNDIYINEINTMPGFTDISMYPKLFELQGIPYAQLLNKLIHNSIEKCEYI